MIIIINNDSNSNNYKDNDNSKKAMLIIGNYKWKCHIIKCFFCMCFAKSWFSLIEKRCWYWDDQQD